VILGHPLIPAQAVQLAEPAIENGYL
jgi:hypothetical protein